MKDPAYCDQQIPQRLRKQLDFVLEVDKLKEITRQTYLASGKRLEDDAEHSWHLALMAVLLGEYAPAGTDIAKTVKMVLIHDLVEIGAGDTFAYDYERQKTAHEREAAAARQLFGKLPDDQRDCFTALWNEFEEYTSAEARFAHALDNCQPLMLNDASGGRGWSEHNVRRSDVMRRNAKTATGAPEIWKFMSEVIEDNILRGTIIDDAQIRG
jgi:putative hydrolase of HD superfamily